MSIRACVRVCSLARVCAHPYVRAYVRAGMHVCAYFREYVFVVFVCACVRTRVWCVFVMMLEWWWHVFVCVVYISIYFCGMVRSFR